MSETVHIEIPDNDWVELSDLSAALNARVSNSGNAILVYVQAESKPAASSTKGHRLIDDNLFDYAIEAPEALWMRALNSPGIASVTPDLAVGVSGGALSVVDPSLEIASGNVPGYGKVNKFGVSTNCDSGIATDIWDGADGATSTAIWVPPTQARTHLIESTDGADAVAGTGVQTMRVYGLTDWDTAETSEVVSVGDTTEAYVIIHRIKSLTFGSGGINAGIITATAAVDGTVTAAVQAGKGQTLMAIYGIPSTQTLQMKHLRSDILRSVVDVITDGVIFAKENADLATSGWITKEEFQYQSGVPFDRDYDIPKSFTGPCIVKFQVTTNKNDAVVTCGFDAYVVDN